MSSFKSELDLYDPLISWITNRRWLRPDTMAVRELAWMGRRIDLALLTRSGRTIAFEFKNSDLGRAIEQAAYNKAAFDRSFAVTPHFPSGNNVDAATDLEVGIIVVRAQSVHLVRSSVPATIDKTLRQRLRSAFSQRATTRGGVCSISPLTT